MAAALRDRNPDELLKIAQKQPTCRPLILSGLEFALQGVTTISEVMRITTG